MLQITVAVLQKFIKVLFGIFGMLFILNAIVIAIGYFTGFQWHQGMLNLFYFDTKNNFPIYFSTFCLITASALLYGIYRYKRQNHLKDRQYWLVLSAGFLYLSIDEFLNLHGMLTIPLRNLFNAGGFLYYAWVIPGIVICIMLAAYFLPFFIRLPNRFKKLFGISALLFVGGAVILELIAARYAPNQGIRTLPVAIAGTVKQSLEWIGEVVFLYSLSEYIRTSPLAIPARDTKAQLTPEKSTPAASVSTYPSTIESSYEVIQMTGKKD